jgi:hypothetical protein
MTRRRQRNSRASSKHTARYGKKRGNQRPSFEMVTPGSKEYADLLNEASVYDEMIESHEESGEKITERDYKQAAKDLEELYGQKKHFNTIKNRFHRYVNEGITGLRNRTPGPEAGSELTPAQKALLEGLVLKRKWRVKVDEEDDKEYFVLRRAYIEEIHTAVNLVPGGTKVSRATVARLVGLFLEEHKEEFILAHKGKSKLIQDRFPKIENKVPGSNARWQYDMRPLPIYVKDGDIICRVIASCIIDDFTQNPIECLFFARKEAVDDKVKVVDTTTVDARRQIALAIHDNNVCPPDIYTDNGSPFREDLKKHLKLIGVKNRNSQPGYPPGRGKVEKFLDLLDEALRKIPGYVEDDDEREQWKKVIELPLLQFGKFLERMNQEIEKIGKKPTRKGGKISRNVMWKDSDNRYALPMPSQLKLGLFANTVAEYQPRVYTIGVLKDNVYYVPTEPTVETELLWARAVGTYIPLRFVVLGEHVVAYVSFDKENWVPVEPRAVTDRAVGEHMSLRGKVYKKINDSKRVKLEKIDAMLLETHSGTVTVDEFFARYDELTENAPQNDANPQPVPPPPEPTPSDDGDIGQRTQNHQESKPRIPVPKTEDVAGTGVENRHLLEDAQSNEHSSTDTSDRQVLDTIPNSASNSETTISVVSPQLPAGNHATRLRERFQRRKQ